MRNDMTATTMSSLLGRVRIEIEILAEVLGEVQTELEPLLELISPDDLSTYRHAQNLDLVFQTLNNLALVLDAAAQAPASGAPVDVDAVTGKVTLSDVAARLRGGEPEAAGGGDLDLF